MYERAFCKYLCPLGAVNAILGRLPLFRIKREASTCISCSKCDKICSMNIGVSSALAIKSPECIACMECVTVCPTKKDTLVTALGRKKFKTRTIVIIGFAIFAGAAVVGQITGMLRFAAPTLQSMAQEGKLKVEDIKGSSTYASVAESFGIELERLYREVGIDMKKVPADTMLKDTGKLAGIDGFEADTVRIAVAKILGIPYSGESGATAPVPEEKKQAAAAEPAKQAAVDPEKPAASAAAKPAAVLPAKPAAVAAVALSFTVPPDFALEGTMTIKEIAASLKTTTSAVIAKLELPADIPVDTPLRDMKDTYGYSMPALKEKIKQ
jgi:ferredoxin